VWQVFNEALEFFSMFFSNVHRWTSKDVRYERGACLRIYGIPIHAWHDVFFKLCVTGVGIFLHADECTVDKARFDFARVLISTPHIEIINKLFEFFIDGNKYDIKLVEEWGCNLGEDVFMSEDEVVTSLENLSQPDFDVGAEEVQGEWELDELVQDLREDWNQHDVKKNEVRKSLQHLSSKNESVKEGADFFQVDLSPVLEPVQQHPSAAVSATGGVDSAQVAGTVQDNIKLGPWSLNWMKKQQFCSKEGAAPSVNLDVPTFNFGSEKSQSQHVHSTSCEKKGRFHKQSVGFIKKIARMPDVDRKHILHILKKHKRSSKRKVQVSNEQSKSIEVTTSNSSFNSKNSKTSHSSVNKDLENWVVVHDKKGLVADVRELGKVVGID
jgi:hypothetical protein